MPVPTWRAILSQLPAPRDARGQSAAEYLGIIVVVAVMIFALTQSGIGDDIARFVKQTVGDISAGGKAK